MTEAEIWCEIARDFGQLVYNESTDFTERLVDVIECAHYSQWDNTEARLLKLLKREITALRQWLETEGLEYYDPNEVKAVMAKMDERLETDGI